MFNRQFTYLLKLPVCLSRQFPSVHLWASSLASSTVLDIVTFVYIVGIYSGKNFALYTFDSDYPDTSLNRLYLTKQSGSGKRGLTLLRAVTMALYGLLKSFQDDACKLFATIKKYFAMFF